MLAAASSSFCTGCRRSIRPVLTSRFIHVADHAALSTTVASSSKDSIIDGASDVVPVKRRGRPRKTVESEGVTSSPAGAAERKGRTGKSSAGKSKSKKRRPAEPSYDPIRSKAVTVDVVVSPPPPDVEPTLSDLKRLRPPHVPPRNNPRYLKLYDDTFNVVYRSFTLDQLAAFSIQMGLRKATKLHMTKAILGKWKLLDPRESAKRERGEAEVQKDFPLLPSELFLLMGSDGSDLLRLSQRYLARLEPVPDPLRLRAFGSAQRLEQLSAEIERKQADVRSDTVKLQCGSGVRPDLIQSISRLSGAFVENIGEGELRITANNERAWERARRLAELSGIQARAAAERPLLAHIIPTLPAEEDVDPALITPHMYALYPFLIPGQLPWSLGYANPFRSRRVGDWLSDPGATRAGRDMHFTGGQWLQANGQSASFKDLLLDRLPSLPEGWTRSLSATPGHLLITKALVETQSKMSLVPPVTKDFEFNTLLHWLATGKGRTTFLPSVPPSVRAETLKLRRPAVSDHVILHRLRYAERQPPSGDTGDSLPSSPHGGQAAAQTLASSTASVDAPPLRQPPMTRVLDFQFNISMAAGNGKALGLPSPFGDAEAEEPMGWSQPKISSSVPSFMDKRPRAEEPEIASPGAIATPVQAPEPFSPSIPRELSMQRAIVARAGSVAKIDVLLPDRPLDMRVRVSDLMVMAERDRPKAIVEHFSRCLKAHLVDRALPESPFHLEHNGVLYDLESSTIVRTSWQEQAIADRVMQGSTSALERTGATVVVESVVNLDSKQESLQCQVYASSPAEDDSAWFDFLAQCEQLTGPRPREAQQGLLQNLTYSPPRTGVVEKRKMYA